MTWFHGGRAAQRLPCGDGTAVDRGNDGLVNRNADGAIDTLLHRLDNNLDYFSIKVINEYRLNLLSPQGNQVYETHLKEFLGLGG